MGLRRSIPSALARSGAIAASSALGLGLAMTTFGQLLPSESKALDDVLFLGNLTRQELSSDSRIRLGTDVSNWTELAASQPIPTLEKLFEAHSTSLKQPYSGFRAVVGWLGPAAETRPSGADESIQDWPVGLPRDYHSVLTALAQRVARSTAIVRNSLSALSTDEKRDVIESLPRSLAPDSKLDFVSRAQLSTSILVTLLERVDWKAIRGAALDLHAGAVDAVERLKRIAKQVPFEGQFEFNVGSVTLAIGGSGSNRFDSRGAAITLDIGGNDVYLGRHGAGVGYTSVLIDIEGDDTYAGPDLNFGSAILGVGLLFDLAGSDTARGSDIAFGAGIGGIGAAFFLGEDGDFRAESMSMGFGAYGAGCFVGGSGNDRYRLGKLGLGAGETKGIGWAMDLGGSDDWIATSSNSIQGGRSVGFGSNGTGIVSDFGGNDTYRVNREGIGSGSDGGFGAVFDAEGDDVYASAWDSIACGKTFGAGVLIDLDGDDQYVVSGSGAFCIGADLGAAILLDRNGSDLYASNRHRPGIASGNSMSLFLDSNGEDRYSSPSIDPRGRIGDSIALFIDAAGPDGYADSFEDGAASSNAAASALDAESGSSPQVIVTRQRPKPGSKPYVGDEGMAAIFQQAASPNDSREDAIDSIVAMGMPAFEWICTNALARLPAPARYVVVEAAIGIGADARNRIGFLVGNANPSLALQALLACEQGAIVEAGPMISQALKRPELQLAAARAAGVLKAHAAVPELMILCAGKPSTVTLYAMRSLSLLGDPSSVGTGQAHLDSGDPALRKAAMRVVLISPQSALASGRLFLRDPNERRARIGCELLSALGSADALKELGSALDDPRSGVRLQAAIGLAGRCPLDRRAAFAAVKRDPNPLVRQAIAHLDPGR